MKKFFKILVITVVGFLTLFGLYRVYQKNYYKGVYESLSNVFLEMNYAETHSGILPGLADFSKAVDGGQSYRDKDITVGMSLESGLSEGETILVYVGIEETFLIEYRRTLPDGRYLFIDYDYSDKILKQTIEVSESDQSLAYGLTGYRIEIKTRGELDLVLYDVVLERWFKNGSQRYSVDNLGDVEIVPLSFSE